jgi:NAD(P)-dependent dehydrogenase (short-subunit alcohol dehydrogenase family)
MTNLFTLSDKNILVTGASSGIGKAIAIQTSMMGASVNMTARDLDRLNDTFSHLDSSISQPNPIACDLSVKEELDDLCKQINQLDGLVLNAGFVKLAPVAYLKDDLIDSMFEVNIQSSIRLIQRLIRAKKIKKGASIVFISSIATQKATIGNAVYNATKGAVNSFVKSLALELASKNIRVNAILPGLVKTNLLDNEYASEEELKKHLMNYPLGRFGMPDDIANLAIYLLANESSWMTGSLINIDGGFSLK